MPKVTRLGDIGSGHGCHFPPTPAVSASPDVNANGIPVVRQGDAYAPHACPCCPVGPHGRSLSGGSGTVYVNGKPMGRVGDAIGCGGSANAGSGDVYAGG
ncbi:PAAR domain-containing protein [Vannielia sp.]|uniref:PAAR domain-containing protein n=1 Tax=Vannielia sp. TaxID=2813045 RepID=UPI002613815B|nr:PAAR domain-containing protein [Vannielia sp.]MDF1871045.1 PAAR domain-containing protein [Vannielia sp.]